ncbi:Cucumber peeling cupredoxin [Glycine max]|nr:Cucumber peeling cupredoxin [Glycine max]
MLLVSVNSITTHIVGDKLGWNMPSYPGFYDEWAKKKTFAVGDVLRIVIILPFPVPPRIEHGGSSRQERLRSLHYQKYHLEETPLLLWRSLGTIFTSLLLASIASLAKSFMLLFLREAANALINFINFSKS